MKLTKDHILIVLDTVLIILFLYTAVLIWDFKARDNRAQAALRECALEDYYRFMGADISKFEFEEIINTSNDTGPPEVVLNEIYAKTPPKGWAEDIG